MTDDERSMTFNIPDNSCDVAEEAIYNVGMERLMRCLELLDGEEREIVLKYYDKNSSFSHFAKDKGIERTALKRQAETTVIKLKRMMSDNNI